MLQIIIERDGASIYKTMDGKDKCEQHQYFKYIWFVKVVTFSNNLFIAGGFSAMHDLV